MVGIELVFTVGVTVALAYELPSEPLYKITQQLREQAKEEKYPTTTTDVPMAPANQTDMHAKIDTNTNELSYINYNPSRHSPKISFNSPIHEYKNPVNTFNLDRISNSWNSNRPPQSNKFDYYKNNILSDSYQTPSNKFSQSNVNNFSPSTVVPPYKLDNHKLFSTINK